MSSSGKTPKLDSLRGHLCVVDFVLSGVQRMNVVGEILTKFFAIGIAGAGAFVATAYVLSNNWL
jgi:hypothetical protein